MALLAVQWKMFEAYDFAESNQNKKSVG